MPATWTQASRVCVDAQSRRISDDGCRQMSGGHGGGVGYWRYYGSGQGAPAMGEVAAGGSSVGEEGASYRSAPSEGISRGGFGGEGEGHGGGGE